MKIYHLLSPPSMFCSSFRDKHVDTRHSLLEFNDSGSTGMRPELQISSLVTDDPEPSQRAHKMGR